MKIRFVVLLVSLLSVCVALTSCFGVFESETSLEFTESEKAFIENACGFELPFMTSQVYSLERYRNGFIYRAEVMSSEIYDDYIKNDLNNAFRYTGQDVDVYDDIWYNFSHQGWNITVGIGENSWFCDTMHLYLYPSSYQINGVLDNEDSGLPEGENGIYEVDFSKAEISTITSLSNNKYACPSVGDVRILVLPICFAGDSSAVKNQLDVEKLNTQFNAKEQSVSSFFKESSFGKLNLNFDIYPELITAPYSLSSYFSYFESNPESSYPVNQILLSALTEIEDKVDLSKYDLDNNGYIDSIVMINTLDINSDNLFQWAYKAQNVITNVAGDSYTFDGKSAGNYVWMSNDFLYDESGRFTEVTIVHELTHTMGVKDYYSTDYTFRDDPVYGMDLMSSLRIDHSPFTKIALGWIDKARLLTDSSIANVKLENYWSTGDVLLLANDFSPDLGCFQEYFILIYSVGNPYFDDGFIVYHVDASLLAQKNYNQFAFFFYNDNDAYISGGSEDNLVKLIKLNGVFSTPLVEGESWNVTLHDNKDIEMNFKFKATSVGSDSFELNFYEKSEEDSDSDITNEPANDTEKDEENTNDRDEWITYAISGDHAVVESCDADAETAQIKNEYKGYPVTEIGEDAFRACRKLTTVIVPNSVTKVGRFSFIYCENLTTLIIGDGVIEIEWGAFFGCVNLTEVIIPDGVKKIGGRAFFMCASLTTVTIPDSVETIGNQAFYGCESLTTVTIPASVTQIGLYAFDSSLDVIYCEATKKPNGWESHWCSDEALIVWGSTGE